MEQALDFCGILIGILIASVIIFGLKISLLQKSVERALRNAETAIVDAFYFDDEGWTCKTMTGQRAYDELKDIREYLGVRYEYTSATQKLVKKST